MIESLPSDAGLSEQIKSVYRRAWESFPEERIYLVVLVRRDDVWRMPEMYEYARATIVPKGPFRSPIMSWYAYSPIAQVANAAVNGVSNSVVQTAVSRFVRPGCKPESPRRAGQ